MSTPLNMHAARMALNRDPELRQWVEQWLKSKERSVTATMTDEEFEKHWLYVRPERMHDGALGLAAVARALLIVFTQVTDFVAAEWSTVQWNGDDGFATTHFANTVGLIGLR